VNPSNPDDELKKLIESNDCPSYARILAVNQLETRKDVCWLKKEIEYLRKLNRWQIGLLVGILLAIVGALLGR